MPVIYLDQSGENRIEFHGPNSYGLMVIVDGEPAGGLQNLKVNMQAEVCVERITGTPVTVTATVVTQQKHIDRLKELGFEVAVMGLEVTEVEI